MTAPTITDYSFEVGGVVFGGVGRAILLNGEDAFSPGTADLRTQDRDHDREDGRTYGRDLLSGPTWTWSLFTDRETPEEALESVQSLRAVWPTDEVRLKPGEVTALRYAVGGRTRRVYGRPGRFAYAPENRIIAGFIPITCDFRCADQLHYDDLQQSITIGLSAATQGGFSFPLGFPMTTALAKTSRVGTATVGGDTATWAVITIFGPVTDPKITLMDGWEIGLSTNLEANQSVTIDPRPWARTVLRSDGASLAGTLTRKTRLASLRLSPGPRSFAYSGSDPSGTSRATVAWRNASTSL